MEICKNDASTHDDQSTDDFSRSRKDFQENTGGSHDEKRLYAAIESELACRDGFQ